MTAYCKAPLSATVFDCTSTCFFCTYFLRPACVTSSEAACLPWAGCRHSSYPVALARRLASNFPFFLCACDWTFFPCPTLLHVHPRPPQLHLNPTLLEPLASPIATDASTGRAHSQRPLMSHIFICPLLHSTLLAGLRSAPCSSSRSDQTVSAEQRFSAHENHWMARMRRVVEALKTPD